jgi:hypothetical protein
LGTIGQIVREVNSIMPATSRVDRLPAIEFTNPRFEEHLEGFGEVEIKIGDKVAMLKVGTFDDWVVQFAQKVSEMYSEITGLPIDEVPVGGRPNQ